MKRILEKIEQQIGADIYHGASLALYSGNWQEFYLGTLDGEQPVRPNLTYDLASVSKVVGVGTVLIQMVKEGRVKLDLPLQAYYPAFADPGVTIRQLLTHTSGIDPYIPNRDQLDAKGLIEAINQIRVTDQKEFKYTDINFILLGLMLEGLTKQTLPDLFEDWVYKPFAMRETGFGPVPEAVPTLKGVVAGVVHDPKAKVLGNHTGSAGLFSTLKDLEKFLNAYLQRDFASYLSHNFAPSGKKERSLAWDKQGDWLLHTGYTGTFVLYNRQKQKAAIFLSNRTYEKDQRTRWILDRDQLIEIIKEDL